MIRRNGSWSRPSSFVVCLRRRAALVFLLLALCGGARAANPDPLNRDTPQSSVTAFLAACQAHDYERAWRYIDLRSVPKEKRLKNGAQLAQQLQQILNRDAQFDLAALSTNPDGDPPGSNRERVDSFTLGGKPVVLELERVTVRSGVKLWVFLFRQHQI